MNSLVTQIRNVYAWAAHAASTPQSPLLLFVRLYWGLQLVQNGWGKLHNLSHVAEFFASLGLPAPGPTAAFVATIEFLGGLLLAAGLFSRFVGLVLSIDMLMAYILADREALFAIISDPDKFTAAAPCTILFAALLILIFGPGLIALDTLLLRLFPHPSSSPQYKFRATRLFSSRPLPIIALSDSSTLTLFTVHSSTVSPFYSLPLIPPRCTQSPRSRFAFTEN